MIAGIDAATGAATDWDPNVGCANPRPRSDPGVYALAVSGTTVYAAGWFTSIGGQPRNGIAALDTATGQATTWMPNAGGEIWALAVSGTAMYAGGGFLIVGGQARHGLAALDAATGIATAWNPGANGTVNDLAVSGTTVYAGGSFTSIGGQTRNCLAALDGASGLATAWDPDANGAVNVLTVSDETIYAGGSFTAVGGQARKCIAALDAATGQATAWNPNANHPVYVLAVSGTTVYAAGMFDSIGGQSRFSLAALDSTTGLATAWTPRPNSTVLALAVSGTTVYIGGAFNTIDGETRNHIAAIDVDTGQATAWNPDVSGQVNVLAVSDATVYAGGEFIAIGGQTRLGAAAINTNTGQATAWHPFAAIGAVTDFAFTGTTVYFGGTCHITKESIRPFLAEFRDVIVPPAAPGDPGATAIGTNAITWTWTDNSSDETGFTVYDDPGAGPPATLQTTTAPDVTTFTHAGLNTNTQYAFQVAATNAGGDSALTPTFTARTLAAAPTEPTVGNPTGSTLDVAVGAGDGNPAYTEYAIYCPTTGQWVQPGGALGTTAAWQTSAAWGTVTVTGLAQITAFDFTVTARNGDGVETAAGPSASGTTLDGPPMAFFAPASPMPTAADTVTFTVTFDESVGTSCNDGTVSVAGTLAGTAVVSGADPNYTVTVTLADANANGTVGITIPGGVVQDLAGNAYAGGGSALWPIYNWPNFAAQPQGGKLYIADTQPLAARVLDGGVPTTYQWKFDNGSTVILGPAAAQWALNIMATGAAGSYWCEVTFDGVVYTSDTAVIEVKPHVSIITPPEGGSETLGGSHTFSVVATGGYNPLSYQWKKDGQNISGANGTEYLRADLTPADSGVYTVEVSDDNGDTIESTPVMLTVGTGLPVAGVGGLAVLVVALSALSRRRQKK